MDIVKILTKVLANSSIHDEIGDFWVVTKPNQNSIIEDILFKTSIRDMGNQWLGGLKATDIIGIFKNESDAIKFSEEKLGAT